MLPFQVSSATEIFLFVIMRGKPAGQLIFSVQCFLSQSFSHWKHHNIKMTVMQLKITERFYLHNIKWPISFSSRTNHLRHIHLTRLVIFADGVKFVLPLRWRGAPCVLTVQTDTGSPRPRQLPFSKHPQPQAYIGHSGEKKMNKQTK